jgi:uncharacterized protein (DUF302 family)
MTRATFALLIVGVLTFRVHVMAADGLIVEPSSFGAKDTMDKLAAEVMAKGLTVFARIDHAAGAAEVGMPLRATELLIFGNAKGGTPLMEANQETGIDLPLKALVFVDATGKVWLAYNDPHWIAKRHGISAYKSATIDAMTALLKELATRATK